MDVFETIRKPWTKPQEYGELVFWFVIFCIAAYAVFDGMRVATSFVKGAVTDAL